MTAPTIERTSGSINSGSVLAARRPAMTSARVNMLVSI
jgi:hypothetical protein